MSAIKRVSWVEGTSKPRAAYSNLTRAGDFIFLAGQVAMDPETGEVPEELEAQLKLIFENMRKLLESEGGSTMNIVKTTAFLADASYHEKYDMIYRSYFKGGYPARSTVQAKLMHPHFKVEIEAIAYLPQKSSKP